MRHTWYHDCLASNPPLSMFELSLTTEQIVRALFMNAYDDVRYEDTKVLVDLTEQKSKRRRIFVVELIYKSDSLEDTS